MNGEYSLLDQTILDKLNRQYQGTPTLTGVPSPSTAVPAISPELMQFGAQMGAEKPEMDWKAQAVKALQDFGPLISQVGTSMMKGRDIRTGAPTETVGSQIGGALTSALGTMKMNEALKKMISQQLSGKGGGAGFSEGQPVGLTGAETVGLTPEQVSQLYGTGLGLRAAELKRPMDNLATISEAYLKVMSGEAKPAEIEAHLATAQKAYQDMAAAPVKNMVELMTKIQGMEKAQAEIDEIKARTTAIPAETKRKEAETKKTVAEEKKLTQELDPAFGAFKKQLETQYGTKLEEVRRGDKVTLTNPITGKAVITYDVSAAPEAVGKAEEHHKEAIKFATTQIAPYLIPVIQAEMAKTPSGKKSVSLQELLSALRPIAGTGIDIMSVKALAAKIPGLADKLDRAIDAYIKTSGTEEFKGGMIRSIVGAAPEAPVVEKSAEKKSILGRAKEVTAGREQIPENFMTQLVNKPSGTYESKNWKVVWDGTKVVSSEKKAAAPTLNFGTYTP